MVRHNLLGIAGHDAPQPIAQPFGPVLSTGLFSRGAYDKSLFMLSLSNFEILSFLNVFMMWFEAICMDNY